MLAPRTIHVVVDSSDQHAWLEQVFTTARFGPVTFVSRHAFLDVAARPERGCILIDIQHGHKLHARLRSLGIRLPTIVIGDPGDIQAAVSAMKQGAFDVIERPADCGTLLASIDRALADAGPHDCNRESLEAAQRLATLSRREHEVLDGLTAGRSNKTIAYELGISVRTVEVHRARMLHRLGVPKVAAAIRMAVIAKWRMALPALDRQKNGLRHTSSTEGPASHLALG